jgi:hypothetical protein
MHLTTEVSAVQAELNSINKRLEEYESIVLCSVSDPDQRAARIQQLVSDLARVSALCPSAPFKPKAIGPIHVSGASGQLAQGILLAMATWLPVEEMAAVRISTVTDEGTFEAEDLFNSEPFGDVQLRNDMAFIFNVPNGKEERGEAMSELEAFLIRCEGEAHTFTVYIFGSSESLLRLLVDSSVRRVEMIEA